MLTICFFELLVSEEVDDGSNIAKLQYPGCQFKLCYMTVRTVFSISTPTHIFNMSTLAREAILSCRWNHGNSIRVKRTK